MAARPGGSTAAGGLIAGPVFAATGHRPDRLGGYDDGTLERMVLLACRFLAAERPSAAISGMALGWDTAWAIAALRLGVPLIAAVPFAGQESRWPSSAQDRYRAILAAATRVEITSPGGYSAAAMHVRNRWMVDNCDTLVALWSGASGGTGACVAYAQSVGRRWMNLWSEFSA